MKAMFLGKICDVVGEYVDSDTLERMLVIVYPDGTRKNVRKELVSVFTD